YPVAQIHQAWFVEDAQKKRRSSAAEDAVSGRPDARLGAARIAPTYRGENVVLHQRSEPGVARHVASEPNAKTHAAEHSLCPQIPRRRTRWPRDIAEPSALENEEISAPPVERDEFRKPGLAQRVSLEGRHSIAQRREAAFAKRVSQFLGENRQRDTL